MRIVKLALVYPALLRRAEQIAWAMVRDEDNFWSGPKIKPETSPMRRVDQLKVDGLEAEWGQVVAAAEAQAAGE